MIYIEANNLQSVVRLTDGINTVNNKYIKLVPHSQFQGALEEDTQDYSQL